MERKKQYDAKETNTWREQKSANSHSHPNDKDTAETNISSPGDESKRADRTMGKGSPRALRETTIGGILNRLRTLQKMHMEYVDTHGQRLEKRLAENHAHKSKVFREMHHLEVELVHLLEGGDSEDVAIEEE